MWVLHKPSQTQAFPWLSVCILWRLEMVWQHHHTLWILKREGFGRMPLWDLSQPGTSIGQFSWVWNQHWTSKIVAICSSVLLQKMQSKSESNGAFYEKWWVWVLNSDSNIFRLLEYAHGFKFVELGLGSSNCPREYWGSSPSLCGGITGQMLTRSWNDPYCHYIRWRNG